MVAATVISALTVLGVTAYFIKRFDENGQEIIDNLKIKEKEHFKELKENIKELVKSKEE